MGFKIIATRGTKRHLEANGIACEAVNKVLEGRPHIVDVMKNGDVHLVFNTTEGAKALARQQGHPADRLASPYSVLYNCVRCGGGDAGHQGPEGGHIASGPFAKLHEPPILTHRDRSASTTRSFHTLAATSVGGPGSPARPKGDIRE